MKKHQSQFGRSIIRQICGWTLMFLSFVGLLLPIVPQLPFFVISLALLAPYVPFIRKLQNYLFKKFPKIRSASNRVKQMFKKSDRP